MTTNNNVASPARLMAALRVENLLINFTAEFHRIWDNTGSSSKPGSFWRPTPAPDLLPGYFPLGDLAVAGRDNINEQRLVAVVCEGDPGDSPAGLGKALSKPDDFELVWRDKGSRANGDCSVWRPIAPEGYVALGLVCSNDRSKPSFNAVRCVRADLVVACAVGSLIWSDKGSGADQDFSAWSVNPPPAPAGAIHFAPGTFVGAGSHSRPTTALAAYALRVPIALQIDTPPALPALGGHAPSTAPEPAKVTQIAWLPWFAVRDPELQAAAQWRTSPLYRLERTDQYVLVGHGHNTGTARRAFKWKASRIQSVVDLWNFTRNTSIDVGVTWQNSAAALQPWISFSARLSDGFAHSESTANGWTSGTDADVIAMVDKGCFVALYQLQSTYRLLREDGSQVASELGYTDIDSLQLVEYLTADEPPMAAQAASATAGQVNTLTDSAP
ncbi:Vps62-related protein [Pseudomonas sp. efr-133-TYG-5]|uniref:Vps62-related protein n=1 Tax=Pseudomonas sp. efr-133-TYG-5 TaxID=3040310 RepID=UPI0025548359|nr:Vps62-related protein [Pseudomonas sp. efr-133-TYG-5]